MPSSGSLTSHRNIVIGLQGRINAQSIVWELKVKETITIPLDEDTAKLYQQMPDELRQKIVLLLSILAHNIMASPPPLEVIMDEISQKAKERGLTQEILDALLAEG
jgi:hypothetical protein